MRSLNNPQFRPPAEANSLILQIDEGCPHNQCAFCGMYKHIPYRKRPIDEVMALISEQASRYPETRKIFLADGDVMVRPFSELQQTLEKIVQLFPHLIRVSAYTNGTSIISKTNSELAALKKLKLHTLYMGLESGDAETLKQMGKHETVKEMVEGGVKAQQAGLRMSVMILLGLGGQEHSRIHAEQTAEALNQMQPRLLSALRVIPVKGTKLYNDFRNGSFQMLTEYKVIEELKLLIECLDLTKTVFTANHSSNILPIEARLPRDKQTLVRNLQRLLESNSLDHKTPGPLPSWL